jgi:hypothetical protein
MDNNSWCSYCDEVNGYLYCEQGYRTDKCKAINIIVLNKN